MNFVSSITLAFKDAFSSGFAAAKNNFAGMEAALGDLNKNKAMNDLAAGLAMATSMTDPFRQKLSAMLDMPSQLAGGFESSMKNIQAITGASAAEIGGLGNELLKIGGQSAAGPLAVAEAFNDVAGGIAMAAEGVPLLDVQMRVLNNALALAEAGQANLGTATEGLTKIMNSYQFTMGSVSEVNERAVWASDVMTQAVGMGMGSMEEFVSAMAPLSGVASSVGVGFDEVGSVMAYMTSTTDSAATAGTKMSAFMTALMKPTDALGKALESVGITSGSAMLEQYGLAASAEIVSKAFNGNQDAIAAAMGRQEAMKYVVSMTSGAYSDFATQFGSTMKGVTESARAVQTEAYESKVERLEAATASLQIGIGEDINAIKGFFVDMGAGFLTHVVAPIMSSPVGGVFQGIAAGVGLAAKSVLDMGSGALNAATQLVVLTATVQNAGGFAKLFGHSLSLMGTPFKMIGGLALKAIGPVIAFGASLWTALAPILPFIAAGAALAALGVLLVKNWDAVSSFFTGVFTKIQGFLAGVSNKVLAVVAVFMPFIGIPALMIKNWDAVKTFFVELWSNITKVFVNVWTGIKNIFTGLVAKFVKVFAPMVGIPILIIKNWDTIKAFFVGLWTRITKVFTEAWGGIKNFFTGLWGGITAKFTEAWNGILGVYNSIWNGITQTAASGANWFSGVWTTVTGTFASVWLWIKDLFTSVWESIKGVVMGFVEWLSPVIDAIIAPFKAIGNVIGGIIDTVGGWFGNTVELGKAELARINGNKAAAALAKPVETSSGAAAATPVETSVITPPALAAAPAITPPVITASAAAATPAAGATRTEQSSAADLLFKEHLAAASRKGVSAAGIDTSASDAFMSAGVSAAPVIDMPALDTFMAAGANAAPGFNTADFNREARVSFAEALRPTQTQTAQTPWNEPREKQTKKERANFTIQNLTLQCDDIKNMFDLYLQLEMIFANPVEAAV